MLSGTDTLKNSSKLRVQKVFHQDRCDSKKIQVYFFRALTLKLLHYFQVLFFRHLHQEHFGTLQKMDLFASVSMLDRCPEKSCPGWKGKGPANLAEHLSVVVSFLCGFASLGRIHATLVDKYLKIPCAGKTNSMGRLSTDDLLNKLVKTKAYNRGPPQ